MPRGRFASKKHASCTTARQPLPARLPGSLVSRKSWQAHAGSARFRSGSSSVDLVRKLERERESERERERDYSGWYGENASRTWNHEQLGGCRKTVLMYTWMISPGCPVTQLVGQRKCQKTLSPCVNRARPSISEFQSGGLHTHDTNKPEPWTSLLECPARESQLLATGTTKGA